MNDYFDPYQSETEEERLLRLMGTSYQDGNTISDLVGGTGNDANTYDQYPSMKLSDVLTPDQPPVDRLTQYAPANITNESLGLPPQGVQSASASMRQSDPRNTVLSQLMTPVVKTTGIDEGRPGGALGYRSDFDPVATANNQMRAQKILEDWKTNELKSRKLLADTIKAEREQTPKPVESEYDKVMQRGRAAAELAKEPGTEEYAKAEKTKLESDAASKRIVEGIESDKKTVTNVLGAINTALDKISGFSTGFPGQILRNVGGTQANDLENALSPVKASLAFDRLQEMRNRSKTGGALGSIAVAELKMLQDSVRSLDTSQTMEQLQKNLDAIRENYTTWRNAINAAEKAGEFKNFKGNSTQAPKGAEAQSEVIKRAFNAIEQGASRELVMKRLQAMGIGI